MKNHRNHGRALGGAFGSFGSHRVQLPGLAPLHVAKAAAINRRPPPVTEALMESHVALQWGMLDPRDPMGHDYLATSSGVQTVVRIDNLRLSVSSIQKVVEPQGTAFTSRLPVWWMHTFQSVALPGGKIGIGAGAACEAFDLAHAEKFCQACVQNVQTVDPETGVSKPAMVRLGVREGGTFRARRCPQCGHDHPYIEAAAYPSQNTYLGRRQPRETDRWVLSRDSEVSDTGMRFREVYPRLTEEQVSRRFPLPNGELLALITGRQELFKLHEVRPENVRAVYLQLGAVKLDTVYMIAANPNRAEADGSWSYDLNRILPTKAEWGRFMIDLDTAKGEGYLDVRDQRTRSASVTPTGRALGSVEVLGEVGEAVVAKVEEKPKVLKGLEALGSLHVDPPTIVEPTPAAPEPTPAAPEPVAPVEPTPAAPEPVAPVEPTPAAPEPVAPVEPTPVSSKRTRKRKVIAGPPVVATQAPAPVEAVRQPVDPIVVDPLADDEEVARALDKGSSLAVVSDDIGG